MNWLNEKRKQHKEIIRYIIFGGMTTVVNFAVFYFIDTILGISYLIANAISIAVSILFAFFTNKWFVFQTKSENFGEWFREFMLFLSLRMGTSVFDMLSMWLLVQFASMDSNLAKLLTQFIVVALNYVFSKLFIFK